MIVCQVAFGAGAVKLSGDCNGTNYKSLMSTCIFTGTAKLSIVRWQSTNDNHLEREPTLHRTPRPCCSEFSIVKPNQSCLVVIPNPKSMVSSINRVKILPVHRIYLWSVTNLSPHVPQPVLRRWADLINGSVHSVLVHLSSARL